MKAFIKRFLGFIVGVILGVGLTFGALFVLSELFTSEGTEYFNTDNIECGMTRIELIEMFESKTGGSIEIENDTIRAHDSAATEDELTMVFDKEGRLSYYREEHRNSGNVQGRDWYCSTYWMDFK